jgi:hypothetical protein
MSRVTRGNDQRAVSFNRYRAMHANVVAERATRVRGTNKAMRARTLNA